MTYDFTIAPADLVRVASPSIHVLLSQTLRASHTFALYAAVLQSRSSDAVYLPFETMAADEDRLAALLTEFRRSANFGTILVSDPFKQRVQPYVDALAPRAERAGSVNLVRKHEGAVVGDNIDGLAFEAGLKEIDHTDFAGRSILFFGCGGVSSAVATLLAPRLRAVGLVDPDARRVDALRRSLASLGQHAHVHAVQPGRDLQAYDVIYNGTGLGKGVMAGKSPLFPEDRTEGATFIDAVYTPAVTTFLQQGLDRGARIVNGRSHMIACTALHCAMITGEHVPVTEVAEIYDRTVVGGPGPAR